MVAGDGGSVAFAFAFFNQVTVGVPTIQDDVVAVRVFRSLS